jgi:hypothetical protein
MTVGWFACSVVSVSSVGVMEGLEVRGCEENRSVLEIEGQGERVAVGSRAYYWCSITAMLTTGL